MSPFGSNVKNLILASQEKILPHNVLQGFISEIYSTLQGEGPFAGERQIFIRLAGCPLRCDYCDTPESLLAEGHPPLVLEEVLDKIHELQEKTLHATVSLTGGEPLSQGKFLQALLPTLKALGLRVYLETAGIHTQALSSLIRWCDVVSMDIKLPSAFLDAKKSFWKEHEEFLKIAGGKAFVKIVLTSSSQEGEFQKALQILSKGNPKPLLILQPATPPPGFDPKGRAPSAPSGSQPGGGATPRVGIEPIDSPKLLTFFRWAKTQLPDVRIQPQMHPAWGLP